jgi:hypothetical protein
MDTAKEVGFKILQAASGGIRALGGRKKFQP